MPSPRPARRLVPGGGAAGGRSAGWADRDIARIAVTVAADAAEARAGSALLLEAAIERAVVARAPWRG